MTKFATIEKLEEFSDDNLSYFSIKYDDEDFNEFERFVNQFSGNEEVSEEFDDLLSWLEKLKEYGAREHFFRGEQGAHALPPGKRYLAFDYKRNLRLYCCRISNQTVFLFNGGIKTASKPQQCPNVYPKFREGIELAKAIDQKIKDREIVPTDSGELIIEDKTLIL